MDLWEVEIGFEIRKTSTILVSAKSKEEAITAAELNYDSIDWHLIEGDECIDYFPRSISEEEFNRRIKLSADDDQRLREYDSVFDKNGEEVELNQYLASGMPERTPDHPGQMKLF